jgi:hypothetical protein
LEPHKKAHFNVQVSDRLTKGDTSLPAFSGVKYNHKPAQTSQSRSTTISANPSDRSYELTISDKNEGKYDTIYRFTGQKSSSKKSYVLLFDPAKQTCTLEPLSSTYAFNLDAKNNSKPKQAYPQIPISNHGSQEDGSDEASEDAEPDPDNPYDFRHFIKKGSKNGSRNDSDFASSPDYRTGTGSAANTPLLPARKPPTSAASSKPTAAARKRKSPEPTPLLSKKPPAAASKKPNPTVRLERKATARSTSTATTSKPKPSSATARSSAAKSAPKSSKPPPKSAEIVHSSDSESSPPPVPEIRSSPAPSRRRSPSPSDDDSDEDNNDSVLTIEVPDARPSARGRHGALASLGLGNNLGLGGLAHMRSPSNGPISLHSAANSVEGSPNSRAVTPLRFHGRGRNNGDVDVIDFGSTAAGNDDDEEEEDNGYMEDREDEDDADDPDADAEGEIDDGDVEPMDIGPPATATASAAARKMSVTGLGIGVDDEDNEADLMRAMYQGLQDESSEESEEE